MIGSSTGKDEDEEEAAGFFLIVLVVVVVVLGLPGEESNRARRRGRGR